MFGSVRDDGSVIDWVEEGDPSDRKSDSVTEHAAGSIFGLLTWALRNLFGMFMPG